MEKVKKGEGWTIAVLAILTGAGILLFWAAFFTVGLAPENPPVCYFAFEHSFPLPDSILALALLVSGILILRNRAPGRGLALVCAGGLMFLGLLDFSFNIQNGMYTLSVMDAVFSGFLNLWCVFFGLVLISRFMKG